MKKNLMWSIAMLLAVIATVLSVRSYGKAAQQEMPARCNFAVPKAWGEFIGAGSYGLMFRDNDGTLRFVNQFPCGLEGDPQISLAVRRK